MFETRLNIKTFRISIFSPIKIQRLNQVSFSSMFFALIYMYSKVKVKSSMARSFPVENLRPQNVGSIINYLQWSTEVAQWGPPTCSRQQPATDNSVRHGRSNWLVAPPPSWAVPPERLVHSINRCSLSRESTPQPSAWEATAPRSLKFRSSLISTQQLLTNQVTMHGIKNTYFFKINKINILL